MKPRKIMKIFKDTAYVRMGGSEAELKAAEYLKEQCAELGLNAAIQAFEVDMATIHTATLEIDGKQITCKGYLCAGSAEVEAPFYYLRNTDAYSLSLCKGKIVMIDGYLGYWIYQDLLENGAVGFITYDGNANYADRDIDQRELRGFVSKGNKIPGVNINAKDAIVLIKNDAAMAKITLKQDEYKGKSHNVVLDLPGEIDEYIVLTAHYDSTSLSQGAYDNMSGSVGILGVAEHFAKAPHRYGLRFIWCGSEERGLLGAKAYCAENEEALKKVVLNINLDMIGCIMGKFIACCTSEEALVQYVKYMSAELGFGVGAYQDVYSSDSTPFADKGIPAISFARIAPNNTATIHNSYDTMAVMKGAQMAEDIDFIIAFTQRMANAKRCPVAREMPENMKEKLDIYLCRKRDKK
ncbi:MAG: Zn-dependent exopeptidase M28 [Oscillospiraceae bacterium]|nr:Zn-dependent exopeptidase M28 [Oscillospiraceae bacterium]